MYKEQPLISIGLPVYNGEDTLPKAIEALLSQTHENIELIISDNCSTDGTEKVVKSFQDERIKYFKQVENLGPTNNFAFVKEKAQGDFFMWHSHDDWLDSNYLEVCLKKMNSSEDIALVAGLAKYYDENGFVSKGEPTEFLEDSPTQRVLSYYRTVTDNGVYYGLIRKSFLDNVDLRNLLGGDWLVIADLAWQGKIIHFDATHLNRNLGGTSRSFKNIVRSLKLSTLNNIVPYVMISLNAGSEVLISKSYENLNFIQRLVFAFRVSFTLNKRIFERRVRKVLRLPPTP
jgi:glycosyltransferase involved in cell wall biosynthesis